jgi:hypothetical protein
MFSLYDFHGMAIPTVGVGLDFLGHDDQQQTLDQ